MFRLGTQSGILSCLHASTSTYSVAITATVKLPDMGPPLIWSSQHIQPLPGNVFPRRQNHLLCNTVHCVDAVWNNYPEQGIKMQILFRWGPGLRTPNRTWCQCTLSKEKTARSRPRTLGTRWSYSHYVANDHQKLSPVTHTYHKPLIFKYSCTNIFHRSSLYTLYEWNLSRQQATGLDA